MKTLSELTREAQSEEDAMLALRRRIWQAEEVASRDIVDRGMTMVDYLCKLSGRIDKERNPETVAWLQQTRRSLRAQLREYWADALDKRRAIPDRASRLVTAR